MAIAKGTTSYKVFLSAELKRDFKMLCVQEGTSMSKKSKQFIQNLINLSGDLKD